MEERGSPYRILEGIGEALRAVGEHGERAHQNRHKAPERRQPIPDPTVSGAANVLAGEAWAEISRLRAGGMPWHEARERILSPSLRNWQRSYGRDCANEAFKAVSALHPHHDAPAHVIKSEKQRMADMVRQAKIDRGCKITWLDELCLAWWGVTFT